MDPFRRVRGGIASHLDVHERLFLARPFSDVAELLGHREPHTTLPDAAASSAGAGTSGGGAAPGDDDAAPADGSARPDGSAPSAGAARRGEGAPTGDDAVLAALDFVPSDAGPAGDRPPTDPALARLLPSMSEDEAIAGELRELTEAPLRADKIRRIMAVVDELDTPTGPRGSFFVRDGQEADVLRAVNDVRLVLGTRLGVGDTLADDELYARAEAAGKGASDGPDAVLEAMAILYTSLTWWQESLINALHTRPRSN
ncbi:DUF2017 family protein [Georgenia sp. Z1344]|uniref:DUF2017 family protein n=1 Tax=Georgenia sp. Z1344 TaxID=3416706 RepID=UPI003CFAE698